MKKNTKVTTFINRETTIILIVIALLFGLLFGSLLILAREKIANNNNDNSNYVVCNVIAASEETYVLKSVNDGSMFEIDISEMYGVGETVLIQYNDNQIINVWLYVDC